MGQLSSFVLSLFAIAALSKGAFATMNCIAYEPFSNKNYPGKIYDALYGDLDTIKKLGFSCIKTYYTTYYSLNVAEVAKNIGLKVVVGILMEPALINSQVEAAISACNAYPDTVLAIYVGNENLPKANPQDIINIRNRIKEKCSKPIGTVQTLGYWLNKQAVAWDVFWAMDWWGYNVYSFFGPLGGKNSVDAIRDQMRQLRNAYPDVWSRFYMTETGWPSDGGQSAGNVANWDNAKNFADGLANMICNGEIQTAWMSYFIFNDPMYKTNVPEFERHFGVASPEGVPKWDLNGLAHCWRGTRNKTVTSEQVETKDQAHDHMGEPLDAPRIISRKLMTTEIVALPDVPNGLVERLEKDDVVVTRPRVGGPASKVQIYNACGFDVTADLLTPQPVSHDTIGARQWKEVYVNEGNQGWVWKLYINGQANKPIQWEFTYKDGKLWYDLSLIDSQGGDLEKHAMTITCSDPNCNPKPNCQWTRCPSAYNADGSKACSIYQVYYPEKKCCYPGEPSYAAAGGSTITLTLC